MKTCHSWVMNYLRAQEAAGHHAPTETMQRAIDAHGAVLDALDRLLRHCEDTNTAFYVTNKPAALREAFKGQKEAMQAARAALAKARGD